MRVVLEKHRVKGPSKFEGKEKTKKKNAEGKILSFINKKKNMFIPNKNICKKLKIVDLPR